MLITSVGSAQYFCLTTAGVSLIKPKKKTFSQASVQEKKTTLLNTVLFQKGQKKRGSLQHLLFPGGHPSKYWAGPTLLNFSDQTRTGVFSVVWS